MLVSMAFMNAVHFKPKKYSLPHPNAAPVFLATLRTILKSNNFWLNYFIIHLFPDFRKFNPLKMQVSQNLILDGLKYRFLGVNLT